MDGGVGGLEDVGDGADVVLVAVGDEVASQLLLVVDKIGHVGDHQIHAVHIVLGEAQTAVHHDHVLAVFQDSHVLADLIEAPEGDDA